MKSNKPLFICFEGIEACGKSTQAKLLSECLTKNNVSNIYTREPGGTVVGEQLRNIVLSFNKLNLDTNILLFTASRHENITTNILPALDNNNYVIVDRFLLSTLVYQGNNNQNIINKINLLHKEFNFNLFPDITFILDLNYKIALERLKLRNNNNTIDNKPAEFHKYIYNNYKEYKKIYNAKTTVINANNSCYNIHCDIIDNLNNLFKLNLIPLKSQ